MKSVKKQIKIGNNRLYLGEDNIQYCIAVGDIDTETAIAIKKICVSSRPRKKLLHG